MPDFLRFFEGETTRREKLKDADGATFEYELDLPMKGAINAALAAGRPLLVRGEPGIGKSQLAEAAAKALNRAFLSFVVNSRTEHCDLLWRFDAVKRLAFAQVAKHLPGEPDAALRSLDESKFVTPGPLWWALDWRSAWLAATGKNAAGVTDAVVREHDTPLSLGDNFACRDNGWTLLIDEIDKAESDVPNGLLEALGARRFSRPGTAKPVEVQPASRPLVVITTNEERALPAAFVRRCLVLSLSFPKSGARELLIRRGRAHFGAAIDAEVMERAADLLVKQRVSGRRRPLPGPAEYLDLLRAILNQNPASVAAQKELLDEASHFVLRKFADASETA